MNTHPIHKKTALGFTLIELMIVVAIVAVLAAIAYPAYTSYIVKAHRAAATACVSEQANYMERYNATNLRYDQDAAAVPNVLPAMACATPDQTGGSYAYTLSTLDATNYTITATPIGSQLTLDTGCATLTLDQSGTRTASGPDGVAHCW